MMIEPGHPFQRLKAIILSDGGPAHQLMAAGGVTPLARGRRALKRSLDGIFVVLFKE